MLSQILALAFLLNHSVFCLSSAPQHSTSNIANAETSLTFLYQNNLNATDDVNHVGAIRLDSMSLADGATACASIGESLLPESLIQNHTSDFENALSYLAYAGRADSTQQYYIASKVLTVRKQSHTLTFSTSNYTDRLLPILCTQSDMQNGPNNAVATPSNQMTITSNVNTFVGFRNQKSFRFIGIPYANPPERFAYSSVYSKTSQTINATAYGSDCSQAGDSDSSEDCLFLNIQTPYIPKAGSKESLRPVIFSIHGGGFTGGNGGPNSGLDGGNMASREDVVAVEINYRLSTLGFLAIPGTDIRGNFGIGDQVNALKVR